MTTAMTTKSAVRGYAVHGELENYVTANGLVTYHPWRFAV